MTASRQRSLELGAIAHLEKPTDKDTLSASLARLGQFVDRSVKDLLVIEGNEDERKNILDMIGNGDVKTTVIQSGREALNALKTGRYDCVVLDPDLPDMTALDLIQNLEHEIGSWDHPIILYSKKELPRQDELALRRAAKNILIKDVKSPEELLDETSLLLHRQEANLPEDKRRVLETLRRSDPLLAGKKILIIDDDIRNIFATTSVLEDRGIEVIYAENGRDGLEVLQHTPAIDAVLMDIMMPDLDGYEIMRMIRRINKFQTLPIIAVTAKAMKDDREKCLEAGATDYITKPFDAEQLFSMLRVRLYE